MSGSTLGAVSVLTSVIPLTNIGAPNRTSLKLIVELGGETLLAGTNTIDLSISRTRPKLAASNETCTADATLPSDWLVGGVPSPINANNARPVLGQWGRCNILALSEPSTTDKCPVRARKVTLGTLAGRSTSSGVQRASCLLTLSNIARILPANRACIAKVASARTVLIFGAMDWALNLLAEPVARLRGSLSTLVGDVQIRCRKWAVFLEQSGGLGHSARCFAVAQAANDVHHGNRIALTWNNRHGAC